MIRDKKGRLVETEEQRANQGNNQTTRADEIIKMFKEQVFAKGIGKMQEDRSHRATKIICTLGE